MAQSGIDPKSIVALMRTTHAVYAVSGSRLARLHEQGVPDAVLDEIQEAQLEAARDEGWQSGNSRQTYWVYPNGGSNPGPNCIPSFMQPGLGPG